MIAVGGCVGGGNQEGMECEERILYVGSRGREKKGNAHISVHTLRHMRARACPNKEGQYHACILAMPPPRHNSVLHNSTSHLQTHT